MHFHYCMGKLVEMGLTSSKPAKCNKCGMKADKAKDCCKHQDKQVKVENAKTTSDVNFHFSNLPVEVKTEYFAVQEPNISSTLEDFPLLNSPPFVQSSATFLRNCNFRI